MAMGSPLGPTFANIFLSHFENDWLKNSPVKPLLYKRYVNDTLWLLPPNSDVSALLSYMNSRHPNMKFTCEIESNDSINFIGLTISHSKFASNVFSYNTTVYRKPTFTSLFLNFNSFSPLKYRLSALKSLTYRALKLCSNLSFFITEMTKIRLMFLRNSFPAWILDRTIRQTLKKLANNCAKVGPRKEPFYIGLPFRGKSTESVRRSLKVFCKKFLPQKDLIIFFKPGLKVSNFFHVKDNTPLEMRSCVVYEFTCASCQASYIGQTTRHLRHRIAEHAGVSHLTGNTVRSTTHSSIREHCSHCPGASCTTAQFKVLTRGQTSLELLVKECLLIEQKKPLLNGNSGSFELLLA